MKSDRPFVVVPVRGIETGKSRLAPILDTQARAAFNAWLLDRTLTTLAVWLDDLSACVVVSACERVHAAARRHGAHVLRETGGGLNAAAALGAQYAARQGASAALVLACDLPRLSAAALEGFAGERADVVIAPDAGETGTNALRVPSGDRFEFSFGPDSFVQHSAAAAARGWTLAVHRSDALAFDVDTPEDYARWAESDGQRHANPMV